MLLCKHRELQKLFQLGMLQNQSSPHSPLFNSTFIRLRIYASHSIIILCLNLKSSTCLNQIL